MAFELPSLTHFVGSRHTFRIPLFQVADDGTQTPLPLTGYRVVVSVLAASGQITYKDSARGSIEVKIIDPGFIEFTLLVTDLIGEKSSLAASYQVMLDVPGATTTQPRGAVAAGQGRMELVARAA